MKSVLVGSILALVLVTAIAAQQTPRPAPAQKPAALRIVVIEGEDAVNIVQQKTAVRPLVEVRDSNDLPVAGATVQFTLQALSGTARTAAFANGQTAVTVTTNAAGRAAAPQLQALSGGALRVNVQATYQGQAATATVNQTNFATVADAAKAGRTPSSSSGAGSGAASGSSLAGTVAGIAGAALSGGLAVQQATGSSGCSAAKNAFMTDLATAQDACVNSGSAQCTTAGQQAANSLGDWCSCDGAANVNASLQAIGTSLAELAALASFPALAFPASCRQ